MFITQSTKNTQLFIIKNLLKRTLKKYPKALQIETLEHSSDKFFDRYFVPFFVLSFLVDT